ncbi:MAG TPA: DUF502 domain-containing protein [Opitutaceae bacterium]|nr:DUF502 domain-containing protein [Opitutaceae bacterium]
MAAPRTSLYTLRNAFVTGLLLMAPMVVTIWAFSQLIGLVGGTFRPVFFFYIPDRLLNHAGYSILWNILGTVIAFVLITVLGYASHYFFGKYFVNTAERLIQGIPGVGAVYNTVKQVVDTFGSQGQQAFNKVVLTEFPRKGSWCLGFLTGGARGELDAKMAGDLVGVFIPTTPNPTSGFLVYVPRNEVIELDMSVGDGMKMIISGGAVAPAWPTKPAIPPAAAVAD